LSVVPGWLRSYRRGTLDMLAELARPLRRGSVELRLASGRQPALELLRRAGLTEHVRIDPGIDTATERGAP
jgi:hypothetical protein